MTFGYIYLKYCFRSLYIVVFVLNRRFMSWNCFLLYINTLCLHINLCFVCFLLMMFLHLNFFLRQADLDYIRYDVLYLIKHFCCVRHFVLYLCSCIYSFILKKLDIFNVFFVLYINRVGYATAKEQKCKKSFNIFFKQKYILMCIKLQQYIPQLLECVLISEVFLWLFVC